MASSELLDLVVTVVSAKHLKNVNWRNGDLKPYVVLYLDQDHRLSTHSDDSGSIKPVWNERITLPLTRSIHESVLNIEIFHLLNMTRVLVGSVRFPLASLIDSNGSMIPELIKSLELVRPSGRPQGKILLKLAIKERPIPQPQHHPPPPQSQPQDYYSAPRNNHYYSSTPPLPPHHLQAPITAPSPYQFTDHYYSGYYYPPPPPRSMYDRVSNYGPSAPADAFSSIDHKQPPRFSNYAPPPNGPSAPVDAFPVNEYKPQAPPMSSIMSSYGVPNGPSAPVDYSPYDHRQLQKTTAGLNLEEERGTAAERSESDLGAKPNFTYGREYRREC